MFTLTSHPRMSWNVVVLLAAAGCSQPKSAAPQVATQAATTTHDEQPAAALSVGKPAPDFELHDQHGKPVRLSALRGKHVILYFYPKDETPGCTKEAQGFRDAYAGLSAQGAVIIGVSSDDDASHRAFAEHHQLPFILVSDPEGTLASKYQVPMHLRFISRQSFLIAPDGTLKKIYRDVTPGEHAAQLAADMRS